MTLTGSMNTMKMIKSNNYAVRMAAPVVETFYLPKKVYI
jgi:hypothetical protein